VHIFEPVENKETVRCNNKTKVLRG
jgi:hypothetical protein